MNIKQSVIAFALSSLFTLPALATNAVKFQLKADQNCSLELDGDTSIPRLYCPISLGLKASEISRNDFRVDFDMSEIPYSDLDYHYGLTPEILEKNGTYVFAFTFLDDQIDGYSTQEGESFREAVIFSLQSEPVTVTLVFNGPANLVNKKELGQVLK